MKATIRRFADFRKWASHRLVATILTALATGCGMVLFEWSRLSFFPRLTPAESQFATFTFTCLVTSVLTGIHFSKKQASESKLARLTQRYATTAENLHDLKRRQESIVDAVRDGIYLVDPEGRITFANRAAAHMLGREASELIGQSIANLQAGARSQDSAPSGKSEILEAIRAGQASQGGFETIRRQDGTPFPVEYSTTPLRGDNGDVLGAVVVFNDTTERRGAETQLKAQSEALHQQSQVLHQQLATLSHQAGMAEVATSVLHNVGNVLNCVNHSIAIATQKVGNFRTEGLGRIAALLTENAGDLPAFFATHPQGKRMPKFLAQLADHFTHDQESVLQELSTLGANLEHINQIVAMQQRYAISGGKIEELPLAAVIEDALRINAAALDRHGTQVIREFHAALPPIPVDRNQLLLILVNLIRNAKYACDESGRLDKFITIHTQWSERGGAQISITDNGVGIAPDHLPRIFEHGFTTRKNGHGFGLHSSALAAREMGGTLLVHSAGPGRGATFTIELPLPA
jgi:PAS domain S-box-containing protein